LRCVGASQALQQEVRVPRRVPDLEAVDALHGDPAIREVATGIGALATVDEHAVIEARRVGERLVQDLPAAVRAATGRGLALVAQRDPGRGGELLDRLGEGQVLDLREERHHTPADAAPEAVERLLRRAHRERWGLLRVEGTEPREGVAAALLELQVLRDDLDDVRTREDRVHVLLPNPSRHGYRSHPWGRKSCSYARSANRSVIPAM